MEIQLEWIWTSGIISILIISIYGYKNTIHAEQKRKRKKGKNFE